MKRLFATVAVAIMATFVVAPVAEAKPKTFQTEYSQKKVSKKKNVKKVSSKSKKINLTKSKASSANHNDILRTSLKYVGGRPFRGRAWCADFMNLVMKKTGHKPTGSRLARSFADKRYGGKRVSKPSPGVIAVLARGKSKTFGHVGVVKEVLPNGDIILVSGNTRGDVVGVGKYSRSRVVAFIVPPRA